MTRTLRLAVLTIALAFTIAATGNPHYVVEPKFEVAHGGHLTVTGSIAGLGNQDIDLTLDAVFEATHDCRNNGGNVAPGQAKQFTVTATQTGLEPKNGRVNFSIHVHPPHAPPVPPACPNRNWTVVNQQVTLVSATLSVAHGGVPQPDLTRSVSF